MKSIAEVRRDSLISSLSAKDWGSIWITLPSVDDSVRNKLLEWVEYESIRESSLYKESGLIKAKNYLLDTHSPSLAVHAALIALDLLRK